MEKESQQKTKPTDEDEEISDTEDDSISGGDAENIASISGEDAQ